MKEQPILQTERLIIRPFKLSDSQRVQELAGNPKIAETTLNIPHPYKDGMAEAWIGTHRESFYNNTGITYAIIKKDDNKLIGAIGLMINNNHRKAELGYWIGVPYWGEGYCTESAREIIKLGFDGLDLNKIYARALVDNIASWTVMVKIGMEYEGTLRHEVIKDGVPIDLKSYAIIREDFINKEKFKPKTN